MHEKLFSLSTQDLYRKLQDLRPEIESRSIIFNKNKFEKKNISFFWEVSVTTSEES